MVNYLLVFPIFTKKIQHIYLSVSETIMFGPWEVKIISYLKKKKKHEKDSHAAARKAKSINCFQVVSIPNKNEQNNTVKFTLSSSKWVTLVREAMSAQIPQLGNCKIARICLLLAVT